MARRGCESRGVSERHATRLRLISLEVPEAAVAAYAAALEDVCASVGMFEANEARGLWRVEGVCRAAPDMAQLSARLALAALVSGIAAEPAAEMVAAEGWLARTASAFPAQRVGQRFVLRGTHLPAGPEPGRRVLTIDAGVAFGSGEHGSTRGCLRALEAVARRRARRIRHGLDVGTGSGVLALAAATLLKRPMLATDIDPWAVRTARANGALNRVAALVRCARADGWNSPVIRRAAPFDLVFANILARPLCAMAAELAHGLAPGGTAILAGLLGTQAAMVLAAHRRVGLRLERRLDEGKWTTLVLRKAERRMAGRDHEGRVYAA